MSNQAQKIETAWSALGHALRTWAGGILLTGVLGMIAACGGRSTPTPAMPPSITTQPTSQISTVGSTVTFSVTAAGTAPLHYQWAKDGTNVGADSRSLNIASAKVEDAGSYTVVITNTAGSATSSAATLDVVPAPTITSFTATQSPVTTVSGTTLMAVFSGGVGTVDGGVGTITSGVAVSTGDIFASKTFTLTVTNTAGTTVTAQVTVDVRFDVYGSNTLALLKDMPIKVVPTSAGTQVLSWAISPDLPAGLTFSAIDGSIHGTPTVVSGPKAYTITAMTVGGQFVANLTITVNANAPLLDLGHAAEITSLQFDNDRVLSQDIQGHWVLWNYTSASILAKGDSSIVPSSGDRYYSVDLAGQTVVIQGTTGFEIRDALDGHILSTVVSEPAWWKLATDGSYLCAGSTGGLFVWSPTGQVLFSKTGNYANAKIFAASGEVRIALGPAGQTVIETISTSTGASSVGPAFSGQFHSWFQDGERFLTNISTTVWTYSKASVQEAIVALSTIANLTGQGNWIWTLGSAGSSLDIFSVSGDATPVASYDLGYGKTPIQCGLSILVLAYGDAALSVIDLAGSNPSRKDVDLPIAYNSACAATSSSRWIVGNIHGVIFDGANLLSEPRYFGFGEALSIAGGTNRFVAATASGKILYFDASTNALEGTIPFYSSKVEISADGNVLAAAGSTLDAQYEPDRTIKVFTLPSGTLTNSWPYTILAYPIPEDFSLSRSGQVIGQVLGTWNGSRWDYTRQVSSTAGGPVTWSDSLPGGLGWQIPIRLSRDGTLIAVSNDMPKLSSPSPATNIYFNGALATAVPGWAVGWTDDGRLLANTYVLSGGRIPSVIYNGCAIYDSTGTLLAKSALPELDAFQTVSPNSVYSSRLNSIFSLTTGTVLWTSPYPLTSLRVGAIAGSQVVFATGHYILAIPY